MNATEIYKVETTGEDLESLVKEGDNIELREACGLPEVKRKSENASAFMFRLMTEEEGNVFRTLFPKEVHLKDYNEYIPNDVLEALKEFNDTCPYKVVSIKVWKHPEYDPDPVLVANVRTEDDKYKFANAAVIIARWGEALLPFEQLKQKAFEKWKSQVLEKLKRIKREVEMDLMEAEEATFIINTHIPHYNR